MLSPRAPLYSIAFWVALLTAVPAHSQARDLVSAPVDPAVRSSLRGHRPGWATPLNDRGAVAGGTMSHLTLVLKRSPERQRAFEQFLAEQQNPASPHFHRWLTPRQVGQVSGASPHDLAAITNWLQAEGLHVDAVANGRMMIDFSGSAALIGTTLATELHSYQVGSDLRIAPRDDPQIPAALSGVIASVSGLYTVRDLPYSAAQAVPSRDDNSVSPAATFGCGSGNCNYIFPNDFSTIYDINSVYNQGFNGAGQTIAIIGRAKVNNADIENFESLSGLAMKDPVVIVPPGGMDPGPAATTGKASGDQLEATFDVQRSTSIAPGATIDLVVSADTATASGLRIAAQYVVDTSPVPAQIMNISFGACELNRTAADVNFWDTLFSQAAGAGISVFVASGDSGAAGCDPYNQTPPANQVQSPNYICASSYATCVGGTEFADASNPSLYWNATNGTGYESALGYIPEGGWNEPVNSSGAFVASASGGGVSMFIATPAWQTGTGVPSPAVGRYTPDLSFTSSGHDGYFGCLAAGGFPTDTSCVVQNGRFGFVYFLGTSGAAPDMAGITALLNQKLNSPQGNLNPTLYQLAANPANHVFHDVTVATSGVPGCALATPSMCNNSTPSSTALIGGQPGFLVGPGYDEVTGLGSLDVANFLTSYSPPDFNWAGSGSHTVKAGQTTLAYNFSAAPAGGAAFTSNVTFSCAFSPADSTLTSSSCVFSPSSILAGGSGTPVTMTITTKGPNTGMGAAVRQRADQRSPRLPLAFPISGVVMVGFAGRRVARYSSAAGLCVALVLLGVLVACGGGSNPISVTLGPGNPSSLYPNDAADGWPTQTANFSASVSNDPAMKGVTWAVTGSPANGTIDATGVYTAPTVAAGLPSSVTITATSVTDPSKFTSAQETLLAATQPTTYTVTVTATEGSVSHSMPVTLTVQ